MTQLTQLPRASIILVNYNSGSYLFDCVVSLLRDPYSVAYEIIVVDNASTDNSTLAVAHHFADVTIIYSKENLGFGGANNLGARHAKGKYLAFLNPDTIVEPGWLEALLVTLEADPTIGLVTSKLLLLDKPTLVNAAGNDTHLTGLTLCRGMGVEHDALNTRALVTAVSGAAFAIRHELFKVMAGFDEAFFMYFEDTDLSWRVRLAGFACMYVPDSRVYHAYTLRFGPQKTYFQERNRYRALIKVLRWPTLLLLLPVLCLGEVITWSFVLLRDRPHWHNKWRAYIDIVRDWPDLIIARKQTQAQRQIRDRDLWQENTYRLAYEQTDSGLAHYLAHFLFDPLFYGWQQCLRLVLWW